jgi:hypothetical protein
MGRHRVEGADAGLNHSRSVAERPRSSISQFPSRGAGAQHSLLRRSTILGNEILRAETDGHFGRHNACETDRTQTQTASRPCKPLSLRRILKTRKPPPLARTTWWWTQSRQTSLRVLVFSPCPHVLTPQKRLHGSHRMLQQSQRFQRFIWWRRTPFQRIS